MYKEAYIDAEKLWNLMTPAEHKTNAHFKTEYIEELKILSGHFDQYEPKQEQVQKQ